MKLRDLSIGGVEITLPDDMLWVDEFEWSPVVRAADISLSGAILIQESVDAEGRLITLEYPAEDMAWVSRETVAQLRAWAATRNLKLRLTLEYPEDTRQFTVMFNPAEQAPVEAKPALGVPLHRPGDWFNVKIKLIEVPA